MNENLDIDIEVDFRVCLDDAIDNALDLLHCNNKLRTVSFVFNQKRIVASRDTDARLLRRDYQMSFVLGTPSVGPNCPNKHPQEIQSEYNRKVEAYSKRKGVPPIEKIFYSRERNRLKDYIIKDDNGPLTVTVYCDDWYASAIIEGQQYAPKSIKGGTSLIDTENMPLSGTAIKEINRILEGLTRQLKDEIRLRASRREDTGFPHLPADLMDATIGDKVICWNGEEFYLVGRSRSIHTSFVALEAQAYENVFVNFKIPSPNDLRAMDNYQEFTILGCRDGCGLFHEKNVKGVLKTQYSGKRIF